ncbi:hypothetical protein R6Q59_025775 [Mikania micrantha]
MADASTGFGPLLSPLSQIGGKESLNQNQLSPAVRRGLSVYTIPTNGAIGCADKS